MSDDLTREDVLALLDRLERGEVRAAEPDGDGWRVNPEVKAGILRAFRLGVDVDLSAPPFAYRDRDTLPPRGVLPEGVRVVPGGTSLRRGAHVARGVLDLLTLFGKRRLVVGQAFLLLRRSWGTFV